MESIEERVAKCESDISHLFHEQDSTEKKIDNLTKLTDSVGKLTTELSHTNSAIKEVKDDIKSMKEAPVNRWNAVVTAVCSGVACTIITALISVIIK